MLVEYLRDLSFDLIDCQVKTGHLLRFGERDTEKSVSESIGEFFEKNDKTGKMAV